MKQSRREFLRQGGRATLALGLGACVSGEGEETGLDPEESPERSGEPGRISRPSARWMKACFRGLQVGMLRLLPHW